VRGIVREDKVNEIIQALDRVGAPGVYVVQKADAYAVRTPWREVA
jgi:hypothetical protein